MNRTLHIAASALSIVLAALASHSSAADQPAPATQELSALVRTPPPPPAPRINGAHVYGERAGKPFFFHVPVTGDRPMTITAEGLPAGIAIDAASGNITGSCAEAGTHRVKLTAANARGTATSGLDIVIGDTICLTPPMGWNSWNHFARRVSDPIIRDTADVMVKTGLIDHGWTYVNIDDCWEGERDAQGRIAGNEKFPDLKGLAGYVHAKGLKFGIYSSPGPKTCAGFVATYQHEDQDAQTYADWGVDYVKYDWCSYGGIANQLKFEKYSALLSDDSATLKMLWDDRTTLEKNRKRSPEDNAKLKEVRGKIDAITSKIDPAKRAAIDLELYKLPYATFGQSLAKANRDILYSFCQYGMGDSWEWAGDLGGNCWRTTGDIKATWKSMSTIGFGQNGHEKYGRLGHWNDPDMLEIGNKGLSPDECYTHMTLWCMLSAPLLIGCDMTKMDPVTAGIFASDEVIAVSQDALGKQGYRLSQDGDTEVWIKPLADGTLAVALFNRGETPAKVKSSLPDLKLDGPQPVRDLWRQKDLAAATEAVSAEVAPHSAELYKVGAPKPQ
jgi:alpha-galactosidase